MKRIIYAIALLCLVSCFAGCGEKWLRAGSDAIVKSESNKQHAKAESSTASTAFMDDTTITTTTASLTPTVMKLDPGGSWTSTAGQGGTLTFNFPTGQTVEVTDAEGGLQTVPLSLTAQLWSPKNATIESLEYDPISKKIIIRGLTTNMSDIIEAQMPGVIKALEATQGMAAEQAKVRIREMEVKGEITKTAADAATSIIDKIPSILGAM